MMRVIGAVVGKTKIQDLGFSVAKDETREIPEEDYWKSSDLRREQARGYIRVERAMIPSKSTPSDTIFASRIADLIDKIDFLTTTVMGLTNRDSGIERLQHIEKSLSSIQELLNSVLKKSSIEKVVTVLDNPVKVKVVQEQESFFIPELRPESVTGNIKIKSTTIESNLDKTLEELKQKK
jgi:hypothetical protein